MYMIDVQSIQALMTIIVLSSLLTVIMTFFSLWFLSKWAEIKELTLKLLKKIDEVYIEQKSEKLTATYLKNTVQSEQIDTKEEPAKTVIVKEETSTSTTSTNTTSSLPPTTDTIKDIIKKRKENPR